jgi:purine-binding chemotaxis protein CheW
LAETLGHAWQADAAVDLACFGALDQVFGVDVLQIREIVRSTEITPLPKAPALIEGVIDMRSDVIPVVDLGRALGGARAPDDEDVRIAILEVDDMVLGLRVASAVDVLQVRPSAIEEPPALATHAGYDAVRAVVRRDGEPPVMVLSLDHLLESVYRSAPKSEGGA